MRHPSPPHRVSVGITDPPGEIGMMGYGEVGQTTAGILNHLYARAYITQAIGHSNKDQQSNHRVLIVHCDLHAVCQLVHQEANHSEVLPPQQEGGFVDMITVAEQSWSRGVGRELLLSAIEDLQANG